MIQHLEELVLSFATVMPLPAFAFLASFVEEIVAPIPSGPVMLVMGSLAQIQGYTLFLLFVLTVIAALGKLAGSLVVYVIADKTEDVVLGRFARFFGVTHTQIESFGARFGKGWKDYVLLTVLRILPFVPSVLVSFGAGALKLPLRLYIISTLIGSIIRDAFFLYLGYAGITAAGQLLAYFSTIESILQGAIVLGLMVAILGYLYVRHAKGRL